MKNTWKAISNKAGIIALSAALGVSRLAGQTAPEKRWKAQWITAPGVAERDAVVLHFRKVVELGTAPKRFLVDVSADNQFILYVNGTEAGRGPSRGDLGHWRYQTYDIAPLLHAGKNTLAATVWHFGTHAAIAQISERTGFLLHGAGAAESIADSNASWDVEEEMGIVALRPKVNGYFAADPGERWDGSRMDWYATAETGNHSHPGSWTKAMALGRGALRYEQDAPNNWQLMADSLPSIEMRAVQAWKVLKATGVFAKIGMAPTALALGARSKVSLLVDKGELTTGYPVVTGSGGHGATIRLTYAEALVDEKGQKGNRNQIDGKHIEGVVDEFLPGGGESKRDF